RDAKVELQAQTGALDNARAGLTRLGLSSDQVATSQGSIRTAMRATAQQADQVTERYQRTAAVSVASSATQVRAQDEVKGALEGLGDQFRKLQSLAAIGIGGGVFGSLVRDVSQTAEAYTNLAARVKLVTGEGAAFDEAFQGVFDVATRTNTAVEETGTLFVRLAEAGKQIGVSQRDALALTESINQAVQISGGSADSAKAAITQLIQGLQSGVLRGEEFNSVMEQSPRLATALAEGLGVTTGELRKMAQQGQLTSETVIGALQGQSAAVAREFEKLPPTVGKSLQNLSTEWTRYVGEVDKANGISQAAATAILALARNLDTVGGLLLDVGQGAAALAAINLAKHFLGMAQSAAAAAAAKTAETA
ncbi:MAG: tape measure protein, partial [Rubrivivax sp.]|nr:tape measure protein [Rubrivivax sp.]